MSRKLAAAVAALGALVAVAPAAGAHVTVNPREAVQGSYTVLAVRVPNERDDASTTRVEFNLPTDTPIRSVRVHPLPGWDYEVERTELDEPIEREGREPTTEVISKITWSGGAIAPDEYVDFQVSLGPLPEGVDQLLFPSIQVYDNGEEVRWINEPVEGEEVEDPAPSLTLLPPEEEGEAAPDDGEGDEAAAAEGGITVENVASQDDVDGANTMGIIGIVVGLIGIAVGGFSLVRSRGGAPATAGSDDG